MPLIIFLHASTGELKSMKSEIVSCVSLYFRVCLIPTHLNVLTSVSITVIKINRTAQRVDGVVLSIIFSSTFVYNSSQQRSEFLIDKTIYTTISGFLDVNKKKN